ncbi:MAG: hypothetical protein ABI621_08900 [Chloroflexota bacterium]
MFGVKEEVAEEVTVKKPRKKVVVKKLVAKKGMSKKATGGTAIVKKG